jgi:hypothetical protein
VVAGRDDVDAGGEEGLGGRFGQAHATGEVLAVGGDEVDAALVAQCRQQLLDGQPAGLADDVADEQDPARPRRARRIAVRLVAEAGPAERVGARRRLARPAVGRPGVGGGYFAYSTARVSRMTVTLIWPG